MNKLTIGERIFEELCFDADVWLTHGLPNESKQIKIIAKIDAALADTMRENVRLRELIAKLSDGTMIDGDNIFGVLLSKDSDNG